MIHLGALTQAHSDRCEGSVLLSLNSSFQMGRRQLMNTSGWDPKLIAMISLNWSFEALHVKLCSLPIGSSFWCFWFVLATVSCLMLGNLVTRRNQNSWCLKMPWFWLRLVRFSQNRDHPKIHQNTYLKRTLQKIHQNTCVIHSEYQADSSELLWPGGHGSHCKRSLNFQMQSF